MSTNQYHGVLTFKIMLSTYFVKNEYSPHERLLKIILCMNKAKIIFWRVSKLSSPRNGSWGLFLSFFCVYNKNDR